ncbi:MAG: SagB/ThcOx family dehydrogenase [Cyanobacteriota bacterium]|nr:SagB/ThcOx family dehydrogenase [Cyanobacteriota bacterium]
MSQPPLSASQRYHEFTKYSPEGLARQTRQLDWEQQPHPYKDYPSGVGTILPLKPYLQKLSSPEASLSPLKDIPTPAEEPLSEMALWQRQRLSQFLFFSYGVTLIVPNFARPFYMRSAPSAGGLYPAEVYVVSRGSAGISAGLYNYQVRSHSLIRFWDDSRWELLQGGCFQTELFQETSLVVITTAVFFRSEWRYEDRAYRRICLDTGHLLGNIELAANLTGYRAAQVGGFYDHQLDSLLFLDEQTEGVMTVLPLLDLWRDPYPLDSPSAVVEIPTAVTALPSPIVRQIPDLSTGQWLSFLHQASQLTPQTEISLATEPLPNAGDKYNFPFCLKLSTATEPIHWGEHLQYLVQSLLTRRSTRQFTGADIEMGDLLALLDFTYHPEHYEAQGLDPQPDYFDLSMIETFIVVNGVKGLEVGCYYYAPHPQELRQIRFKNFREEVCYLCLGQDLGRDAGAVVVHTADLRQAVSRYGERAYRYLHMDAGHLGQRLNVAATRLGLGVSGIAGFFDDQVNEVLGIPLTEAALYITTLGCRSD